MMKEGVRRSRRHSLPFASGHQIGFGAGYNYANIDVQIQFGDIIQKDFEYEYKFRGPVVYAVLSF